MSCDWLSAPWHFLFLVHQLSHVHRMLRRGCLQRGWKFGKNSLNDEYTTHFHQLCIQETTHIQHRQQLQLLLRLESTQCCFTQAWDLLARLSNATDGDSQTEWWMNVSGHDVVSTGPNSNFYISRLSTVSQSDSLTATTSLVRQLQNQQHPLTMFDSIPGLWSGPFACQTLQTPVHGLLSRQPLYL